MHNPTHQWYNIILIIINYVPTSEACSLFPVDLVSNIQPKFINLATHNTQLHKINH